MTNGWFTPDADTTGAIPAATPARCDCRRGDLGMVAENSGHCPVHPLPGCPNPDCGETWVEAFHGDRCDSCGWRDPADVLSATQPAPLHIGVSHSPNVTAGPLGSSPELTPHPGPPLKRTPGPHPPATEAGRLDDPIADAFHLVDCACADPYGVVGHVEEYGPLADMTRKTVIAAAVESGEVVPAEQIVPRRYPVEAKVVAGGKGALWAGIGVGVLTVLFNHLGAIGTLYGGEFPWLGGVLAIAAVVLPAAIGTWQGYDAPHTPRPGVQR